MVPQDDEDEDQTPESNDDSADSDSDAGDDQEDKPAEDDDASADDSDADAGAGDDQIAPAPAAPDAPAAKAATGAPLSPTDKDQIIRDALAKEFGQAADPSAVQAARANAARLNNMANMEHGLETMFTAGRVAVGGPGADKDFSQGLKNQGAMGVAQAQQDREQAIRDFVTKQQLGQQAVAANQEQQLNQTKIDDNTPGSPKALALAQHVSQLFPKYPISQDDAKNLSVTDISNSWNKPTELKIKADENVEAQKLRAQIVAAGFANKNGQKDEDRKLAFDKTYNAERGKYQDDVARITDAMSTIDQAVGPNGGVASSVVPAALAKSIVNRVTQGEIGQFSGDPSVISHIQALWSKADNGTMTNGNAQEFKSLLASQLSNRTDAWAQRSESLIQPYAQDSRQDPQAIRDKLGAPPPPRPRTQASVPTSSSPGAPPAAPAMVKMQAPDGSIRLVPPESVEKYQARGAKVLQ